MENRKERIAKLCKELRKEISGWLEEKFEWVPPNVWPGIFGIGEEVTPEDINSAKQFGLECPDCRAIIWTVLEEQEELTPFSREVICPECGKICIAAMVKLSNNIVAANKDGSEFRSEQGVHIALYPVSLKELEDAEKFRKQGLPREK